MRSYVIAMALVFAANLATATETAMPPAPIVFFDIAGPDAGRLKDFYALNFGWGIDAAGMIKTPNLEGVIRQDPPEKIIYVGVPDLDAAMARVKASGGSIESPKLPTPDGQQFVLFKDPAGNRMGMVGPKS